jgi:hypothetical protein
MRNALIVAAAALAVRLWLILEFPIVYGGDSLLRLVNRDRILISYQLPLLQALIWAVTRISTGVLCVRLLMAALGAFAAVAFYRFAADFAGERAALAGALLFATDPFLTPVSSVPYQEILLLGCLLAALRPLFRGRDFPAALWLGLACLTRFEAWAACPVFAFVAWRRGRPLWQCVLLFAWAPLLWLAFRGGLSEPGTFVLDRALSFGRLYRILFLAFQTAANTTAATLALAALGAYAIFRERRYHDPRLRALAALLAVFAAAILFSAHGVPPDLNRYVTTREIHIPLALLTLAAAIGCAAFPRLALPLAVAGVATGAAGAWRFVAYETARPEIRLGYELARYLDSHVLPGESIAILSPPIDTGLYLRRAFETGGAAGIEAAHKVLAEVDTSPLDVQRTRIHSHLPASQFATRAGDQPRWIAVWSTYVPQDDSGTRLSEQARSHPDRVLTVGEVSVCVRRRPSAP